MLVYVFNYLLLSYLFFFIDCSYINLKGLSYFFFEEEEIKMEKEIEKFWSRRVGIRKFFVLVK